MSITLVILLSILSNVLNQNTIDRLLLELLTMLTLCNIYKLYVVEHNQGLVFLLTRNVRLEARSDSYAFFREGDPFAKISPENPSVYLLLTR